MRDLSAVAWDAAGLANPLMRAGLAGSHKKSTASCRFFVYTGQIVCILIIVMLTNANKETTMSYYGIDDGDGNQVSTGLTERDAYRVAQERANERDEPMFVYEVGSDAEAEREAVRVDPQA